MASIKSERGEVEIGKRDKGREKRGERRGKWEVGRHRKRGQEKVGAEGKLR